jgi:HAD superfamily phosphoserine phosphatase-like hydrolase
MDPGKCKASILKIFVGNTPKENLELKARNFIEHLLKQKIILPAMLNKLTSYKANGATVAIVSASPDLWIKPFCEKFGIICICTELNYVNNIFTGRLNTPNCKGPEKEKRIRASFDLASFSLIIAYGHGPGDKEMLAMATETHSGHTS